jgi:hypothetical protein
MTDLVWIDQVRDEKRDPIIVTKVIAPIREKGIFHPFDKGVLVENQKGTHWGIVKDIKEYYQEMQIAWWKEGADSEIEEYEWVTIPWTFTTPLPLFRPGWTLLEIPQTTVLLENGEITTIKNERFFLKYSEDGNYHISNPSWYWIFPQEDFPGIPLACLVEIPAPTATAIEGTKEVLTPMDIGCKLLGYLQDKIPCHFLDQIYRNMEWELDLKEVGRTNLSKEFVEFSDEDFDLGWERFITDTSKFYFQRWGIFGIKEGNLIRDKMGAKGIVSTIDVRKELILVEWMDSEKTSVHPIETFFEEFKEILAIQVSDNIAYYCDRASGYLEIFIGFKYKYQAYNAEYLVRRLVKSNSAGTNNLGRLGRTKASWVNKLREASNPTKYKLHYHITEFKSKKIETVLKSLPDIALEIVQLNEKNHSKKDY